MNILDEVQKRVNFRNYSDEEIGRAVRKGVHDLDQRVAFPKEDELDCMIQLSKQISSVVKSMVLDDCGDKHEN